MSLNGPDELDGPARTRVGAPCVDAPLNDGFLLDRLPGRFTILAINTGAPDVSQVDGIPLGRVTLNTDKDDPSGAIRDRYLGVESQAIYLIRPDQRVAARWHSAETDHISAALRAAIAKGR